ncbi:MAG: UDP-phosphate galactose phosphotransferase [Pseudonocardiales bacterium]|nr:MAG: UDP-phosphate galactose phosphotransferase [Pseudonocardiales bacterium]
MFTRGIDATDGAVGGGAADLRVATASSFPSAPTSFGLVDVPVRQASGIRRRLGASGLAPVGDSASIRPETWVLRYQLVLLAVDTVAASVAVALAFASRFGAPLAVDGITVDLAFGLAMPLAWVAILALNRAYEARVIGSGPTEFERVFRAFLHLSVLTGFAAYASKADVARGFIVVALPLALTLDLAGRQTARAALRRRRARGRSMTPVLAIGGPESVARFTALLRKDRSAGMRVVGACVPAAVVADSDTRHDLMAFGVPVLGDVDSIRDSVRACGARSVAVLAGEIDADKLRWIAWELEGTNTDLVVSPGLTEVCGRRLHIQPIAGMPLLHVSEPEFAGVRHILKSGFDRIVAGVALVLLAPVLLGVALVIRCTSDGPAVFRQTRVGKNGKPFKMIKFRSMYVGAERRISELLSQNEAADGLLFKIREDPRVTRVGRVLRRWSLDELPQLINVLNGSMSLVGPRPPLPTEVIHYGSDTRRRLLVKPGLTGLWQVSGRSDLSWEESVRLDLHYVENWSLVLDVVVLWKTARAVMRREGAY